MAQLGELERVKRRRLQEAYADLRSEPKPGSDRQAKLRSLLLGSASDAGLSGGSLQAVREAAAAAAASIAAVSESPGGKGGAKAGSRRGPLRSQPGNGGCGGGGAGDSLNPTAQRCLSAPAQTQPAAPGGGADPAGTGRHPRCPASGPPVRAPPPGPMEGGFLQEGDPVLRLSRMQGMPGSVAGGAAAGAGQPRPLARAAEAGCGGGGGGFGGPVAAPRAPAAASGHGLPAAIYDDDADLAEVDIPSDVELALISMRSDMRAHPPCADLPPLVLRSQLSYVLADRSTVERQLDEQRRANRVRVFKLPTGADEFGVLSTSDYRAVVWESADAAAAAAHATTAPHHHHHQQTRRAQSAPGALGSAASPGGGGAASGALSAGAYGAGSGPWPGAGGGGGAGGRPSRWHAAAGAFLRGVVDRFTDFQLSHAHLVHLLSTAPAAATQQQQQPQQQQPQRLQGQPLGQTQQPQRAPADARPPGLSAEAVEEQVSALLHLGCLARHTDGDADAYVLAVPRAGKLVKAVLGGRKELTTWLSKRQHREAPEEQICKLKLRGSCLPASYHVKDLVGRGAALRLASTSGHMVRLAGRKR